ncbi:sensor histidine kinase [Lichenicoccus roseus]|uniref:histidine kinase n=1 Tax=Lichenicoccus roseus TaxID=2683649 RepID=A0A5R9J0B3_9PROT|nr:HAMP domain-containing sensor histidine kinase [Lichenicoccus roseus]TLU71110.1 HAMP domain-containing histidine kinase [Lichenicoccus roseus]
MSDTTAEAVAGRGRARRLIGSSLFRLMLLYAGLFSLSVMVLFVVIGITTDGFMTRQIDATVANEVAEVRADAGGDDPVRLRDVVHGLVQTSPGFYYLLQDRTGHVLAGNMSAIHPTPGQRSLERSHRQYASARDAPLLGDGVILPDGSYLFVGSSAGARREMRLSLLRAFAWSLGIIVMLGLGGGLLMSMLVLRRIEAISRAIRTIMGGNLSQRIPVGGSDDEFDHLSDGLNRMLDRIETLVGSMRQISNDIAHDLRTPLTRLRQRLELAHRDATGALAEQLDAALTYLDGILATFTSLLRISQIEARIREEDFTDVALTPLVQTLIEAYGPTAEAQQQTLTADLRDDLMVRGDSHLLTQLLANLVENALRHTPVGSHVSIGGTRCTGGIVVTVADDGPGIPADQHDFVLGRFARLDASRSTPGSGLGLSLVKAVAGLHGASLELMDNQPGLLCQLLFRKP